MGLSICACGQSAEAAVLEEVEGYATSRCFLQYKDVSGVRLESTNVTEVYDGYYEVRGKVVVSSNSANYGAEFYATVEKTDDGYDVDDFDMATPNRFAY